MSHIDVLLVSSIFSNDFICNKIFQKGREATCPGAADCSQPTHLIVSKLDKRFLMDRIALAKGVSPDSPLKPYRAQRIVQSLMTMGDLDLVEVRIERPYSVECDAVTNGKGGVTNIITLVFESE